MWLFCNFQATDADSGAYGRVQYSLASVDQDNENLPFYLSNDNILSATKEFNYNDKRQFVFSVTAFDSPADSAIQQSTETTVYVSKF